MTIDFSKGDWWVQVLLGVFTAWAAWMAKQHAASAADHGAVVRAQLTALANPKAK